MLINNNHASSWYGKSSCKSIEFDDNTLFEVSRPCFFKKETKKSPWELHYVFSEEASSYPCVSRIV